MFRLLRLLVLVWLVIGAIAAGQRGDFTHVTPDCARVVTIAVTVIAGPLNYAGVNPKPTNCSAPHPSS